MLADELAPNRNGAKKGTFSCLLFGMRSGIEQLGFYAEPSNCIEIVPDFDSVRPRTFQIEFSSRDSIIQLNIRKMLRNGHTQVAGNT